jgi:hypothetical protein
MIVRLTMKRYLLLLMVSSAIGFSSAAWAAKSEPMDVDIDIQKTLVKEKTKEGQRNIKDKNLGGAAGGSGGSSAGSGPSSCGNIDIGNSTPSKGAGQFAKPTTVIVTGPVINANNNCK